ncbi:MAG: AmmeMemoRadiSam system protein A [Caldisericota bacterium]|nr:AmmeMemoRadiSam system protein A [Caldisericota bacterium]
MEMQLKKDLLKVARDAIKNYLDRKEKIVVSEDDFPDPESWEDRGTFVTLTINGKLRGCIGTIVPVRPLILDVIDNAINAAFRDPRFYPLAREEFFIVNIELSILTIPTQLKFSSSKELLNKVRPNIDGVIIRRGPYQATFLPQVWDELPDKEAFFKHLCLKAGLSEDCFQMDGLEVYIYHVDSFPEEDFK